MIYLLIIFLLGVLVGIILIATVYQITIRHAIKNRESWCDGLGNHYIIKKFK